MHALIASRLEEIASICRNRNVLTMAIFGSVLTSKFNEASDIDFVVTFGDVPLLNYADNYFELKNDLEALFGREVQIITSTSLENPYLIEEIERTKQTVYAA